MIDKPRGVAVIGGNRIPFARSNSAYLHASNQDMLRFASPASTGVAVRSPSRSRWIYACA
jgi:hypothetical protein